jgi:hypothetical protein
MSPAVTSVFLSGPGPLVDRVRDWLREEYRVSTTTDPAAVPSGADPDVAIVDCRPTTSDLDALSATVDDCRIAAVVRDPPSGAADPLPVDEVLVEPLSRTRVLRTVERFDRRLAYEDALETLPDIATTRAAANAEIPSSAADRVGSNDPARTAWTVADAFASDHLAEFDPADFRAVFRRPEFRNAADELHGQEEGSPA